jgi:hypothetical protein
VATEAISVDVNFTPFKGVSNTQAVRAARENAAAKGDKNEVWIDLIDQVVRDVVG